MFSAEGGLEEHGYQIRHFDLRSTRVHQEDIFDDLPSLRGSTNQNILRDEAISEALSGCVGVVHLAAVSRVLWGQRDPDLCWQVNVQGTRNVLHALAKCRGQRPWMLFASSREVYGQPQKLPVQETHALLPHNVYGRSKAEAECLVWAARTEGFRVAVLRLTNVYGCVHDHPDRLVPALTRKAFEGGPLLLTGAQRTFDLLHICDAIDGIIKAIGLLEAGENSLPPVHLLSGYPVPLIQIAQLINEHVGKHSIIQELPENDFDVTHFYGDPTLSQQVLGWKISIPLTQGIANFAKQMKGLSGQKEFE